MDAKEIQELIKTNCSETKYEVQRAYSRGAHLSIYQPRPKASPDNRKSIPFIKRAIAMIMGYMMKPGNITYQGDYYEKTLKDIYDSNDEELLNAQLVEDGLVHGKYFELHWLDESGLKTFFPIPVDQSIPIYSKDLKKKLTGFIWVRDDMATFYDDTVYQVYEKVDKKDEYVLIDEGLHGYGRVPVNCGQISRDKANLFDHVIGLVDLFDKLLSEDVANEAERSANSYLLMSDSIDDVEQDENGLTAADRVKQSKAIDNLGDEQPVGNKVQFLTKNINTSFLETSLTTTERLIYEMLMIVNPNDDNFAAASGIAQAYKLLGMEYLCAGIETYLSIFLQNRIQIIAGIDKELQGSTEGADKVTITFTRNLPKNLLEISQIAAQLQGTLSKESIINLFPTSIVPDKQAELDRLNEETPELDMETTVNGQV